MSQAHQQAKVARASGQPPLPRDGDSLASTSTEAANRPSGAAHEQQPDNLEKIPVNKKKVSDVWVFFGQRFRRPGSDSIVVSCKLCNSELVYCNTSNLRQHLTYKHKDQYVEELETGKKVRL